MNEEDVRALVREAIDRHLRRSPIDEGRSTMADRRWTMTDPQSLVASRDASHVLLKVAPGSQIDEGMCVIEPTVRCNHCGFCQSYGH